MANCRSLSFVLVLFVAFGASVSTASTDTSSATAPFGWVDSAINERNGSSTIGQNGALSISGWAAEGGRFGRLARLNDARQASRT